MYHIVTMFFVVCLFISQISLLHAENLIEKRFSVEMNVGEVLVRYEPKKILDNHYSKGRLNFFWASSMTQFQSVESIVLLFEPQFDIIDVNGDGFNDVVFYNQYAGYGSPATRGAHVLIYVPKRKKFFQSVTLSDRGEISLAKTKGCTLVNFKSGPTGYTTEEWCFNLKTGRWKLVHSEGGEAEIE